MNGWKSAKKKKIILHEGYALVELSGGKWAKIDVDDIEKVKKYSWSVRSGRGKQYAMCKKLGDLHHLIIGKPAPGTVVDHINGDSLDNRKSNLRTVSQSVNACNRSSPTRGVIFCPEKKTRPWRASVQINGRRIALGYHQTETEALNIARAAREKRDNA